MNKILNIGVDFSRDPIGRYKSDGERSGEVFRENFLLPALRNLSEGEKLEIIIDDGVESYGSSFLSEAFAGVVKYGYYTKEDLLKKIEITFSDSEFEFFKTKIIQYIHDSKYKSKNYGN